MKVRALIALIIFLSIVFSGCISKEKLPAETPRVTPETPEPKVEINISEKIEEEKTKPLEPLKIEIRQATPTHITSKIFFKGDVVQILALNEKGQRIPFSDITYTRPSGWSKETTTSSFGDLKLRLLEVGEYKIKASKEGYSTVNITINVKEFPPKNIDDYPLYTGEYAKPGSDWITEKFYLGVHTGGNFVNPTLLVSTPRIKQGNKILPVSLGENERYYLVPNYYSSKKEEWIWDIKNMKVNLVDTPYGPMARIKIFGMPEVDNEIVFMCDIRVPKNNKYPDLYPYVRNTQGNEMLYYDLLDNGSTVRVQGEGNEDIPKYWKFQADSVEFNKESYRGPCIGVAFDYKNEETIKWEKPKGPSYRKLSADLFWEDWNFKTKTTNMKMPIWDVDWIENEYRVY